jgi:hypothetical protein
VDHPVKHVAKRAVHAASRLHDTAILGHIGDKPVDVEGLGAAQEADSREGIGRLPSVGQGAGGG